MGISQQLFGFYKYFPTFFDKFVIMVHSIAIKRCVGCIHKRLHGRPIFEKFFRKFHRRGKGSLSPGTGRDGTGWDMKDERIQ